MVSNRQRNLIIRGICLPFAGAHRLVDSCLSVAEGPSVSSRPKTQAQPAKVRGRSIHIGNDMEGHMAVEMSWPGHKAHKVTQHGPMDALCCLLFWGQVFEELSFLVRR